MHLPCTMLLLTTLAALLCSSMAGHYLFWLPFGSKSMKIGIMELSQELGARGHTVTVVSAYGSKAGMAGVRDIVIASTFQGLVQEAIGEVLVRKGADVPWLAMIEQTIVDSRAALTHPEVQELLAEASVDVVCVVPFGNEVGYYLAQKLNATLALLWTGTVSMPHINWAMGNPHNPATVPMPLTGYTHPMTFPQRIINTLATGAFAAVNEFYLRRKTHALLEEVFPEDQDIPTIAAMAQTSSLLVTHGSPFLGDGLRPTMPHAVHGALMGCRATGPLEGQLKAFVEGAEHGVIFISFGSLIKPSMMPEEKRQMMVRVLGRLQQRVVWKWDGAMANNPANVMVSSWLPQPSLLAHPNLRLFITHAGAGSLQVLRSNVLLETTHPRKLFATQRP